MNIKKAIDQTWGKLDESWQFAIVAFIVARVFFAIWSGIILIVQPIAVHYIGETNNPGVVFLDLYTNQTYAYNRQADGNILTFRPVNKTTVTDLQSNSSWDISTGTAIEGKYKGFKLSPTTFPSDLFPYHNVIPYQNAWLAMWQRFDANWYTSLAENRYGNIEGDDHFPPLYPLLINLTKPIFGNGFIAGLVISHLATLYALK